MMVGPCVDELAQTFVSGNAFGSQRSYMVYLIKFCLSQEKWKMYLNYILEGRKGWRTCKMRHEMQKYRN